MNQRNAPKFLFGWLALTLGCAAPGDAAQAGNDEPRRAMVLPATTLPDAVARAWDLEQAGQSQQALDALAGFLQEQPDHWRALLIRGRILTDQGQLALAEVDLKHCVRLAADEPSAWLALGVLLHHQLRFRPAAVAFDQALALAPEDAVTANVVGTMEANQGRLHSALHRFAQSRERDAQWQVPSINHAVMVFRLGDRVTAIDELEHVVEQAPELLEARLALADIWLSLGCTASAAQELAAVIRHDEDEFQGVRTRALRTLGTMYAEVGNPDRAISCYEASILESTQPMPIFDDLAVLYRMTGRHDDAAALLRLALRMEDRSCDRLELAEVLDGLGRSSEALVELREAFDHGARNPRLLWALARMEEERGDAERAARVFAVLLQAAETHGSWLGQPEYLSAVIERSHLSNLPQIASPVRATEYLERLRELAANADLAHRELLAADIERVGLPADFLDSELQHGGELQRD